MIVVLAKVQIVPDRMPEALALSREHVARSRAEPGCLSHAVYEDPDRENLLVFVEEWESEQALWQHFAVPQSGVFAKTLRDMAAARPAMRLFTAAELPFPARGGA